MPEPVTILGASGALGFGLALRLGAAGVPVTVGSRDAGRARETADALQETLGGGTFDGAENPEAAGAHDVVFLCVPFRSQSETLQNVRPAMREGQLLVDATVPLAAAVSGKATRTLGVWQGSAAQQAQEMAADGVRVVAALHTVNAPTLKQLDHGLDEDVLVCGNKRADKRRVAEILDRVDGLRCVDAGPLEMARIVESMTAMLIGVNGRYKTHAGVRITGLPDGHLFPPLKPKT